ncbi:MAG: hypothetical protein JEY99_08800 [Spirochaetales bacterium]|nr:hypothetical protein [Spirochaetales bacterium]
MGLYEQSMKTKVRITGSNTEVLAAIQRLSDDMGSHILEGAEIFITREIYELLVSKGYYKEKPRAGSDRRAGDRRKGPRRDA